MTEKSSGDHLLGNGAPAKGRRDLETARARRRQAKFMKRAEETGGMGRDEHFKLKFAAKGRRLNGAARTYKQAAASIDTNEQQGEGQ